VPLTAAAEEQVARKYLAAIDPTKPWMVIPKASPDGAAIVQIEALVHEIFASLKANGLVAVTGVMAGPGAATGTIT
jgi:hypothetical protein